MTGPAAGFADGSVEAYAVIANPDAQIRRAVNELGFDGFRLRVAEGVQERPLCRFDRPPL